MKTNKFAAGALALAMGLAAIAPAYADTTTTTTTTETTGTTNAEYPAAWQYTEAGKAYVDAFKAWRKAVKEHDEALAKEAEAAKKLEAAKADLKAYYDAIHTAHEKVVERYGLLARSFQNFQKNDIKLTWEVTSQVHSDNTAVTALVEGTQIVHFTKAVYAGLGTNAPTTLKENEARTLVTEYNNDVDRFNVLVDAHNALVNHTVESKLVLKVEEAKKALEVATENRKAAAKRLDAAYAALEAAREKAYKYGASRKVIAEAEKLGDITIITKETKTTTEKPKTETKTTTTTTETVKPGKVDKGISAETRAKLEAAIRDAEIKIESVKFLKENTPKTIAKVVDKLDKIVAEQKELIKSAKELLGQKVGFSLISTAYADDEKTAEEKAKELTDKLNENTAEIEKTLKENEANQGKEEKPADTKKPEEKPADNKKPADTKKPSKEAGNNAKTGIAGVAGVAGVLAAASVAYATSKKNK